MSFDYILNTYFTVKEDICLVKTYLENTDNIDQLPDLLIQKYLENQSKSPKAFNKLEIILKSTNYLLNRLTNLISDQNHLNYLFGVFAKINSNYVAPKGLHITTKEVKQRLFTKSQQHDYSDIQVDSNQKKQMVNMSDIPEKHRLLFQKFSDTPNIISQLKIYRNMKNKRTRDEAYIKAKSNHGQNTYQQIQNLYDAQGYQEKQLVQDIKASLQDEVATGIQKYQNLFKVTSRQLELQSQQLHITNLKFYEEKLSYVNKSLNLILNEKIKDEKLLEKEEKLKTLYNYIFTPETLPAMLTHSLFLECELLTQQTSKAIADSIEKECVYSNSQLIECELVQLQHFELIMSHIQPKQLYTLECLLKSVGGVSIFDYPNHHLLDSFIKPDQFQKSEESSHSIKIVPRELLFREFDKRKQQLMQQYASMSDQQLNQLLTLEDVIFPDVIQDVLAQRQQSNQKDTSLQRIIISKSPLIELDKANLTASISTTNYFVTAKCSKYLIPGSSKVYYECLVQKIGVATIGIGIVYQQYSDTISEELQQLDPKLYIKNKFIHGDGDFDNPSLYGVVLCSDGFLYRKGQRDYIGGELREGDIVQVIIDCDEEVLQFQINNTPLIQILPDGSRATVGKIDIHKEEEQEDSNLSKLQLLIDNLKSGGSKFTLKGLQQHFKSDLVRDLIYNQQEMLRIAQVQPDYIASKHNYEFIPAAVVYNIQGTVKVKFAFSEPWMLNCPFGYGCQGYQ